MKPTVIIIGAGAAGLIAARELSEKKYNVTILESREQAGGRIRTYPLSGHDGMVEGGAEFIHGRLPITLGLCREADIIYTPVEGKMYRKQKNDWVEETEMVEGWDELIRKMGAVKEDTTLHEFLLKNYPEQTHADLRRHVNAYVQGFDLADPRRVSVQALYKEWSHEEEENYRIPQGYTALIQFLENACLANGCTIVKGDAVKQVDWQHREVTAYVASGKKYRGEMILVTVPLPVLASVAGRPAIHFTPAIDEQVGAAAGIGFGTVIKVALHFSAPFWKADTRFIFSEEMFPTWWTQLPLKNNLLTGWAGGPNASLLGQQSDAALLEIALASLSGIFDTGIAELRSNLQESYIFNWREYEDALGAYSYPTLQTNAARKVLNTPLEDTVFFAGEGLYEGNYPGTVEAALASGMQAAGMMLDQAW